LNHISFKRVRGCPVLFGQPPKSGTLPRKIPKTLIFAWLTGFEFRLAAARNCERLCIYLKPIMDFGNCLMNSA
jgi:hypothetical protein